MPGLPKLMQGVVVVRHVTSPVSLLSSVITSVVAIVPWILFRSWLPCAGPEPKTNAAPSATRVKTPHFERGMRVLLLSFLGWLRLDKRRADRSEEQSDAQPVRSKRPQRGESLIPPLFSPPRR